MSTPTPSRLIFGAMGLGGPRGASAPTAADVDIAHAAVDAALAAGITMFDHADIYGGGLAEQVFGVVLRERPGLRERIVLQTKCGISPGFYDFSAGNIRARVAGSLERLGVDSIDVLLLHRPDPLMDAREVAGAFAGLREEGLVTAFGVSNMSGAQMAYLQQFLDAPLVANQLELSLARHDFVDSTVLVNQPAGRDTVFPHGTLEYCQTHGVELQAWGPLAQGRYSGNGRDLSSADAETAALVARLAEAKQTTREAVVLAWLLRHPAGIRPVIGTSNPERIAACAGADRQAELLTREEWYALFVAARGAGMP